MEKISAHPLAKAFLESFPMNELALPVLENVEEKTGRGILADYKGRQYLLGNEAFMRENGLAFSREEQILIEELTSQAKSPLFLGEVQSGTLQALFSIEDSIREESFSVIEKLKKQQITPILLSGDNKKTVLCHGG